MLVFETAGVVRRRYENDLGRICKVKHEHNGRRIATAASSSMPIDAPRA